MNKVRTYATILRIKRKSTNTELNIWSPIYVDDWADIHYVTNWAAYFYPGFVLDEVVKVKV